MNILFWDIDGTLIRTSKAGLYAFEQAVTEQWGKVTDWQNIKAAGMTDHYIAAQIIQLLTGRAPGEEEIIALTQRYEELLPMHLEAREGQIMPSVLEILDYLHGREDYKLLLLTGNSRTGAEWKLRHFGLIDYFDFSRSAFCDRQEQRIQIAQSALAMNPCRPSDTEQGRIFVIGDTPHDIECGQAIGAYTVGVATGTYSVAQLSQYSPWWVVEKLPGVEEFVAHIENL